MAAGRNNMPEKKTRYAVFDTKNMRLYSWIMFPSREHASAWLNDQYSYFKNTRPRWFRSQEWHSRKKMLENHVKIVKVRWHVSRFDALKLGLVETKKEREAKENVQSDE